MKQWKSIIMLGIIAVLGLITSCTMEDNTAAGNGPVQQSAAENPAASVTSTSCPVPYFYAMTNANHAGTPEVLNGTNSIYIHARLTIPDPLPTGFYTLYWYLNRKLDNRDVYTFASSRENGIQTPDGTVFTIASTLKNVHFDPGSYRIRYYLYNGSGEYMPPCYSQMSTYSNEKIYYNDVTYSALPINSLTWSNPAVDGTILALAAPISSVKIALAPNPSLNFDILYAVKKNGNWIDRDRNGVPDWFANGTPADTNNQTNLQGIKIMLQNKAPNMRIRYRLRDSSGTWSEWAEDGKAVEFYSERVAYGLQVMFLC